MVDMDGQVQLTEKQDTDSIEATPEAVSEAGAFEPIAEFQSSFENQTEPPPEEAPAEGQNETPSFQPVLEEAQPQDMTAADSNWFDQGLDTGAEGPPPESTPAVALNDFSDISDFGNQDVDVGALQFELKISGIDRKDLRADVLAVLGDPRLFLNMKELEFRNGELTLPGLNAARTSLIVSRLQHLDLQFQWRQRVYEV